jgi:catechol 2,3-dioxygenase-like lactoylglutathione lyase family enzyme
MGDFMQIRLASAMVDNQEKALRFYTDVLGFVKKMDMPMAISRLTVTAPEGAEGVELVLEPIGFAPADTYQRARFAGVVFRGEPKIVGPITTVLFEDTCGNLINLVQVAG